jgi:ribosomal protein S18 acetylase RimI-like enzyme
MTVRDYHASDLPALSLLYVATFNLPPWSDGWTVDTAGERLGRLMSHADASGVVAEDEGQIVGFALGMYERFATGEQFYLREMCTAPSRQRAGIGAILLQELSNRLASRQVRAIYLETRAQCPAEAFYKKQGFAVLGYRVMARRGPCP